MTVEHIALRLVESQRFTEQEITIGGVRVLLKSRYCYVTDRWYLSIYNTDSVLIVGSIAVVPAVDLLLPYKHLALPQGELFSYSVSREPPTFTTLDNTARLLYR